METLGDESGLIDGFIIEVLKCLLKLCNFKPTSNIRFIYFDNVYISSYQKNTCNVFLYVYIIAIWRTRKENLRIGNLKCVFIRKLSEYRETIKHISNDKFIKLTNDLYSFDTDQLMNLKFMYIVFFILYSEI